MPKYRPRPKLEIIADDKTTFADAAQQRQHAAADQQRLKALQEQLELLNERHLRWGGQVAPVYDLAPHFLVAGTTRSGKTLSLRLLCSSLTDLPTNTYSGLLHFGKSPPPDLWGVSLDPKQDMYPILRGMQIPATAIRVLNPFDRRSWAWDLAQDLTDTSSVDNLADKLFPVDKKNRDPFFDSAAQDVCRALILTFHERGVHWYFNDIIEPMLSPELLACVLQQSEEGQRIHASYFQSDPRLAQSVVASVRVKARPYATIARLWCNAPEDRQFSLTNDWLPNPPNILLLGYLPKHSESLGPINRAFFRAVTDLVLSRPETTAQSIFFLLDELRFAGKLDSLNDLLLVGASKHVRVAIGFQDIEGLYEVYGEFAAGEIIGQCGNVSIFRLTNPRTMQWASQLFGDAEFYERSSSAGSSSGEHGNTSSAGEQWGRAQRPSILPSQFAQIPLPSIEAGLTGYHSIPGFPPWRGTIGPEDMQRFLLPESKEPADQGFIPRDDQDQRPRPWTSADFERLRLDPPPSGFSPLPDPEPDAPPDLLLMD